VCAWVCFSDCLFSLHISLGKGAKTFYAFFIHIIRFERKCTIIIIIIITIAATKAAQTAITITAKCTAVASGSENWVWAVTTMAQQWPREQGPKTPTIASSIYSARSQRTEELPATVLRRQQQHWFYISAALPANFLCRHFHYHYMHTHTALGITAFLFCHHTCSHIRRYPHTHTRAKDAQQTHAGVRVGPFGLWLQATEQMCDRCTSMAARDVKLKTSSQPSKLGIYAGPQHGNRFFLKNKHTIIIF